jgi:hypothetical protein
MTRAAIALVLAALVVAPEWAAAQAPAAPRPPAPPPPAPALSADDLGKLLKALASDDQTTPLNTNLVAFFELGAGPIPVKQLLARDEGTAHIFIVSAKSGADDIILSVIHPSTRFFYLTNRARVLRAAVVVQNSDLYRIPNDEAADGFQNALQAWADVVATDPRFKP